MRASGLASVWSRWWFAGALGAVIGCLLGSLIMADLLTPSPLTSDSPARPVVVSVQRVERSASFAVGIRVESVAERQVIVRRSGIVTTVNVAAFQSVANGEPLVSVDATPLIAMLTETAPYRNLKPGDSGDDVRMLQRWLTTLGHRRDPISGRFDLATAKAMRRLQARVGQPRTGTFDLGMVLWVGTAPAVVDQPPVAGSTVRSGQRLLSLSSSVRAIGVTEPGGLPAGDYWLEVAGTRVPYVAGSGSVRSPADARLIAQALGPATEGTGRLLAEATTRVLVIPASAVITDEGGATCVFGADLKPTRVTVTGGGFGGVELAGGSAIGEVVANPLQVVHIPSCG